MKEIKILIGDSVNGNVPHLNVFIDGREIEHLTKFSFSAAVSAAPVCSIEQFALNDSGENNV